MSRTPRKHDFANTARRCCSSSGEKYLTFLPHITSRSMLQGASLLSHVKRIATLSFNSMNQSTTAGNRTTTTTTTKKEEKVTSINNDQKKERNTQTKSLCETNTKQKHGNNKRNTDNNNNNIQTLSNHHYAEALKERKTSTGIVTASLEQ